MAEVNDKWECVVGNKGIYVIAGTYNRLAVKASAGTFVGGGVIAQFPIQELLDKYPYLASARAKEAAAGQTKLLKKWEAQIGVH